mmetsp:Transcript_30848/g.69384  ORF Transcript_30848/g.69384 Transcript_30848/m.69384 type:complete len:231 (+) Transcript_30848:1-693(+)
MQRARSAGVLGRLERPQDTFSRKAMTRTYVGTGPTQPNAREGEPGIFEEIIRTDEFFGPILQEIKANYEAAARGEEAPSLEASAAEMAVDAIRRPWIEEAAGDETERAGTRGHHASDKVHQLEKENAALRQLVRRFHSDLKREAGRQMNNAAVSTAMHGRQVEAVPSFSFWSSPEPLAAAMLRPPRRRPKRVPALNLSQIWDFSDYDEEEETEDSENDSEIYDSPEMHAA